MNGYFMIVNNGGKCGIKLFPPTNGGQPILREEILEYLSVKNMTYDVKELGAALVDLQEPVVIKTSTDFRFSDGEFAKVAVAPDNMSVILRLFPPFEGGAIMSKQEFMREYSSRGICFGFDEAAIDKFLSDRVYCTDFIGVRGLAPVQGSDASIEYFFNTDPRVRPTLNEDGTVDFFHLNTINHCKAGDMLARLIPAVQGQPGRNVKGEYIRPREVKMAMLKHGNNITMSEDKTVLTSNVDGHVNLVEGKVFVSNIFQVENVDNSVGDIDYDGNVNVNGNVRENFTIKAHGNIVVKGIVEGATLEADGDIIIARGMHGMHKGVLKAGGNIICKFLENATASAKGYVETELILHSEVVAGTDIKVTGSKGLIAGGRCCATTSIEVKNLGSEMGADTTVEVGMDSGVKMKISSLQKEIVEINKTLASVKPVLEGATAKLKSGIKLPMDQLLQIQKLAQLNKEKSERLQACMEELNQYQDMTESETKGQIIVTGNVFPGTKICISDASMLVKTAMKYCRFIKDEGEVKMVAIY